jgi:hypothetical protein
MDKIIIPNSHYSPPIDSSDSDKIQLLHLFKKIQDDLSPKEIRRKKSIERMKKLEQMRLERLD